MSDMKQGSAPSLHVMIEAMKRAYADRARYLGDPDFVNAPIADPARRRIMPPGNAPASISTARRRAADALSANRRRSAKAATPRIIRSSTASGNAVSNTYTLNFPYGVGLVADGTGVLLNNELDDFTAAPGASNAFGLVGFRGQSARPRQAAAVVDVADHRAEGRQAGAGDGHARRQPHHLGGAADHRQRARLQDGCRRRGGRAAPASSMDAGRGAGRARLSARDARRAEGQGPSR